MHSIATPLQLLERLKSQLSVQRRPVPTRANRPQLLLHCVSPPETLSDRKQQVKAWNARYYLKKKLRTAAASDEDAAATPDNDPFKYGPGGKERTAEAKRMAKCRRVAPAVQKILGAGGVAAQAATLQAVIDHPSMAAARERTSAKSSAETEAALFLVKQTGKLLKRGGAHKARGNSSAEKRDSVETVMVHAAPSPEKAPPKRGQKAKGAPSVRTIAGLLDQPRSTVGDAMLKAIKKREQLSAGEKGVYWARAKRRKGYSKITGELRELLLTAFYDHPMVIVSPNAKDTLLVRDAAGEKQEVRKVLTQVGLGTIFSDIVRENPEIKGKVGERSFRYIVSSTGRVRRFKDSHKQMCGCTECVGMHSMHRSLQAKRVQMLKRAQQQQQQQGRRAKALKQARGWGSPLWHDKPAKAIAEGACRRWNAHAVPHWECQTLKCTDCKPYPVPKEEAREDDGAEQISFHVYEYKEAKRKDGTPALTKKGKPQKRLELELKRTSIGEFHRLFYGPALRRFKYHHTSFTLAPRCRGQRRDLLKRGSVASHRDYGERLPVEYNEQLQSGYFQNTSVSVEGASLEWLDAAGKKRTRYFGHWSDDSKQDASATTRNMRCELCEGGGASKLVEGLEAGGTVYKGTDGDAKSYRCGRSIYGQSQLSAELGVAIDAQVEAPGHGKSWLDGMTGFDKGYLRRKMCAIVTPEAQEGPRRMQPAKWVQDGGEVKAASPAVECVRLLRLDERAHGIKSEGMRAKRDGEALVERRDYDVYSMADVEPLPDFQVKLSPGDFNGIRAHYHIRTDPDLGLKWAALRRVACGCDACAKQLALPWKPGVARAKQPRYARNKACELWPSYEGANDWKICELVPKTASDAKGARESMENVLSARVTRMSLQIVAGEVAAYATTDDTTPGYYLVVWRSGPYTLQERANGVAAGRQVADAEFFNQVPSAPGWFTPAPTLTTVVDVAHVLRTGIELLPLSDANKLPANLGKAAKKEAKAKKAAKVDPKDHEAIMEEALQRDQLVFDDSESESESENESEDEPEMSDDDE